MNNNEEIPQYSKLVAILEETLHSTNQTRLILRACCDEIHCLLHDWYIHDTSSRVEEPECIVTSYDEPEDMAKDIEEALEYAKNLRANAALGTQKSKRDTASVWNKTQNVKVKSQPVSANISKSKVQSSMRKVPKVLSTVAQFKDNSRKPSPNTTNKKPVNETYKVVTQSSSVPNSARSSSRDILRPRKSVSPLQTTYQKDFSIRPTLSSYHSVQRVNVISKHPESKFKNDGSITVESIEIIDDDDVNTLKFVSSSGTITGADLSILLGQKSIRTSRKIDTDLLNANNKQVVRIDNCEFRNSVNKPVSSLLTVDLQEAVDIKGVPPELVNVLKLYHKFINKIQIPVDDSETNKNRKTARHFVEKLENLNRAKKTDASYDTLVDLYSEISTIFVELSIIERYKETYGFNEIKFAKLQEKFDHLERVCHTILNLDKSASPVKCLSKKSLRPFPPSGDDLPPNEGWTLSGIWNERCKHLFIGMMQVPRIRYKNAQQLGEFEAILQKIQRVQLQMDILELLSSDILPQLCNLDFNDPLFLALFKMCSALCSMAFLSVPVLIRL